MAENENPQILSITELIDALHNGRNNPETRRMALKGIVDDKVDSPQERLGLLNGVEIGWRREGEVPEEELDTLNIK